MSKEKPLPKGLDKLTVSSDDICRLLKTAAKSGVRSIRLTPGALEVTFSRQDILPVVAGTPAGSTADEKLSDEIMRQALTEDIEALEQTELAELMIRDPAEYERRVVDGSLVDDTTRREEENSDD